jgi:hypothetical protein
LYVGIAGRDLQRAQQFGLRGGRRRFLHLALTPDDAREAGRRAGREYAVLQVYALDAWEEGINFFDRKTLYLAEQVPTQYLEVLERGSDGYEPREFTHREGDDGPMHGRGERRAHRHDAPHGGRPMHARRESVMAQAERARSGDGRHEHAPASASEYGRGPREFDASSERGRGGDRWSRPEQRSEPRTGPRGEPRAAPPPRREEPPAPAREASDSGGFGLGVFEVEAQSPRERSPAPRPSSPSRPAPPPASDDDSGFGAGL